MNRFIPILVLLFVALPAWAEWGSLDSDSGLLVTPPQQYFSQMRVPDNVRWNDPRIVRGSDLRVGSVIAINEQPYVVSCKHDRDQRGNGCEVLVGQRINWQSNDGASAIGECVSVHPQADCSLWILNTTYKAHPFYVAQQSPPVGTRVRQAGFPMGQQLRDRYTIVTESSPAELRIRCSSINGDSGSPIINDDGELCGVLFGGDIIEHGPNGEQRRLPGSMCVGAEPIRQLIASVAGNMSVELAQCYNGNCYGGRCYSRPPVYSSPPRPQLVPVKPVPQQPPVVQQPPQPQVAPCPCGPKWESLAKWQAEIEAKLTKLQPLTEQQVTLIVEQQIAAYMAQHPVKVPTVPTTEEITAAVTAKLPPLYIRVQDPRGAGYSTDYQPAKLGQYVTLPFGPAN